MDCLQARDGLWPPERPRLAETEVLAARRHVEECASCQEYFAQDRALLDAYNRMRRKKAPRRTRERVFDVLARERAARQESGTHGRTPNGGRWIRPGAVPMVAAVVLLVALGSVLWSSGRPGPQAGSEGEVFVEDYLRRAVAEDRIVTSDPDEVARFLERELGIFDPPLLKKGFRLASAEICLLEGERGAMLRYEGESGSLSHYMVPRPGSETRAPKGSGRVEAGDSRSAAVITWATPSLEQALVGSLSHEQLVEIASSATSM